jgi:hypothetical protein
MSLERERKRQRERERERKKKIKRERHREKIKRTIEICDHITSNCLPTYLGFPRYLKSLLS